MVIPELTALVADPASPVQVADAPVQDDEVKALPVQEEEVRALPVQEPLDPEQLPVKAPANVVVVRVPAL